MKLTATQMYGELYWVRRTWISLVAGAATACLCYSLTGKQIQPWLLVREPVFLIDVAWVLALLGAGVFTLEMAIRAYWGMLRCIKRVLGTRHRRDA